MTAIRSAPVGGLPALRSWLRLGERTVGGRAPALALPAGVGCPQPCGQPAAPPSGLPAGKRRYENPGDLRRGGPARPGGILGGARSRINPASSTSSSRPGACRRGTASSGAVSRRSATSRMPRPQRHRAVAVLPARARRQIAKNRVHLDIHVEPGRKAQEAVRLTQLGAELIATRDDRGPLTYVMRDSEGNGRRIQAEQGVELIRRAAWLLGAAAARRASAASAVESHGSGLMAMRPEVKAKSHPETSASAVSSRSLAIVRSRHHLDRYLPGETASDSHLLCVLGAVPRRLEAQAGTITRRINTVYTFGKVPEVLPHPVARPYGQDHLHPFTVSCAWSAPRRLARYPQCRFGLCQG